MFGMGPWELLLILGIALVIFGPGKLPEVGKSLGKGFTEFKKASEGLKEEITDDVKMQEKTKGTEEPAE